MSTESLAVEQRVPVVVRFAYSQVVRNGWSKQNCTSYLISHGFNRLACDELYNHIVSNNEECVCKLFLGGFVSDRPIIRTQIIEGPNSIIKNLPLHDVQPSTGTDDHSDVMDQFRIKQLEEPRKVYCGIVSAHLQVIMNDYPERCANTSLVTGYGYAGYASPNPNEAPVYIEDNPNGDSDDDSLIYTPRGYSSVYSTVPELRLNWSSRM